MTAPPRPSRVSRRARHRGRRRRRRRPRRTTSRRWCPDRPALSRRLRARARSAGMPSPRADPRPRLPAATRAVLLLTGWTDYAFSSDNVPRRTRLAPASARARRGATGGGPWVPRLPTSASRWAVRRRWWWISAGSGGRATRVRMRDEHADLVGRASPWPTIARGAFVSRPHARLAGAREPALAWLLGDDDRPTARARGYDYAHVSLSSPWKAFPGRYTREGDVRELLHDPDDVFVVARAPVTRSRSPSRDAPRTRGRLRRDVPRSVADGFSKEMDINSASPDVVLPLPARGHDPLPVRVTVGRDPCPSTGHAGSLQHARRRRRTHSYRVEPCDDIGCLRPWPASLGSRP